MEIVSPQVTLPLKNVEHVVVSLGKDFLPPIYSLFFYLTKVVLRNY